MHLNTLNEVLNHLKKAGLRLKKSKCHFMLPSVVILGYKIDVQGLHPYRRRWRLLKMRLNREMYLSLNRTWGIELLLEVSAKLVYNLSTLVWTSLSIHQMGLEEATGRSILDFEKASYFLSSAGALWSYTRNCLIMWCIGIWDWCSFGTSIGGWIRITNRFCLVDTVKSGKEVFPNWKGRVSLCVWGQEISCISL